MEKILVIAAHPDDEILGVGATIAKRTKAGDKASALILGEGQTSRWNSRMEANQQAVEELHSDTYEAAGCVGYSKVMFENFPDNRFDSVDLLDIVKRIERVIDAEKPTIIYTHHGGDLNVDHQRTFQAVITATRPIGEYSVKEIYTFETLSSTEWNFGRKESVFFPNTFVKVDGDYFERKCQAMGKYKSELREFPHPRSIEGMRVMAKKWGSVIGTEYAEAFELIRKIDG